MKNLKYLYLLFFLNKVDKFFEIYICPSDPIIVILNAVIFILDKKENS